MHGIDSSGLKGYSFHVGAANVGLRRLSYPNVRSLCSSAYLQYIHISGQTLAATSGRLISPLYHLTCPHSEMDQSHVSIILLVSV